MTDQHLTTDPTSDEDTEAHMPRIGRSETPAGEDDTKAHMPFRVRGSQPADDAEAHGRRHPAPVAEPAEDAEGHRKNFR